MKYLRLYEAYTHEDDILEIEDILLEVKDLGYEVILQGHGNTYLYNFRIRIFKIAPQKVNFDEVKDCLLRLKGYVGDRFVDFAVYQPTMEGWRHIELCEDSKLDYDVDQCLMDIRKIVN